MKIVPIRIPSAPTTHQVSAGVTRAVSQCGLRISLIATLAKYRGSVHWHIVKPGAKGTLELTYWPQMRQAWFAVHENRRADWIKQTLPAIKQRLQSEI